MKISPRKFQKPVRPDDFSGVYGKGKKSSARPFVSGGDPTNVSEQGARRIGKALMALTLVNWILVGLMFRDLGFMNYIPMVTILLLVGLFVGEMLMLREFPQRKGILFFIAAPMLAMIVVGNLVG
ncbi:hypothetical protein OAF87_00640 [Akkermansiaceae bacterium]|nr:hypothetical protein [Akkermansiaceae bacterium]MDB4304902.1 hypothetical protein [Akkermansiaceae bacterium]MDB4740307.1 hypothetical protein [Akkermansiaceae bacterium]MDC1404227.1 hypothetical protein [Akkermansiaceae bacterium]